MCAFQPPCWGDELAGLIRSDLSTPWIIAPTARLSTHSVGDVTLSDARSERRRRPAASSSTL